MVALNLITEGNANDESGQGVSPLDSKNAALWEPYPFYLGQPGHLEYIRT